MPPPPLEFEDSSSALAVPPYSDCPGTAARVEKDDTFCAAAAPPRDLDTWLLYGRRYDLREFLSSHPGGDLALLLGRGGTDATALFEQYHQRASAPRAALAARPWHDASGKSHDPAPLPTSSAPGSAGEAFHSELRAALEALPGGPRGMSLCSVAGAVLIATAAVTAACWVGWATGSVPAAIALSFVAWLLAANASHDATHFALFRWSFANELAGLAAAPLIYNTGVWVHQHVIAHHVHTNVHGRDFDLHHQAPFTRLHDAEPWKPGHAGQAAFILVTAPLSCFVQCTVFPARLLLGLPFMGQPEQGDGGGVRGAATAAAPLALRLRAAMAVQLALTLVVAVYPALRWGFSAATSAWALWPFVVSSTLFMAITQVSHVQDAAQRGPAEEPSVHWAERMVATSVDYSQDSHLVTFLTGGLNMQGLHHCAPTLPSSRFIEAYPIYRALAVKHGLQVHEAANFGQALGSYWKHIRNLAQPGAKRA